MSTPTSVALSHLHDLLQQLGDAESALAHGPRAIVLAEKQAALAEQKIAEQKQVIKDARKVADELNLRLKTREAELMKLQGQLNTASSNKEYDIIKGQIVSAKNVCGEIEQSAFEAMESIDSAQAQLRDLEVELKNRKKAADETNAAFHAKKPELEAAIAGLESRVAEAEQVIPQAERDNYARLKKVRGADAMSDLEDDFCRACSSRATPQDMVNLRLGEFRLCRDCGRVLYLPQ